jgi:hypothetical protein
MGKFGVFLAAATLLVLTGAFGETASATTLGPLSHARNYSPIEAIGCVCGPVKCACRRVHGCVWRHGVRICG